MKCQETCLGYQAIGMEACYSCAGMGCEFKKTQPITLSLKPTLSVSSGGRGALKNVLKVVPIPVLRADGRCIHGMIPNMCSYCAGIPMTEEREYHKPLSHIRHLGIAFMELLDITDEEE